VQQRVINDVECHGQKVALQEAQPNSSAFLFQVSISFQLRSTLSDGESRS
jgi:hypothetical protein